MTESMASRRPSARLVQAGRASPRQATKTANPQARRQGTGEAVAKAKPGASEAKPVKLLAGGNPQTRRRRRRPRAGLHRGHAGLETRPSGAASTRSSCAPSRRAQGGQMEHAFYGHRGPGLVPRFHCITKYVKVVSSAAMSLRPVPPGESKSKDTATSTSHEDEPLDEAQVSPLG